MTATGPSPGDALADRVRAALSSHAHVREVREVRMFGGLSFMVDDRLAVAAGREGDLLVCVDPADFDDLCERGGEPAEMGTGRPMGRGWLSVPSRRIRDDHEELTFWIEVGIAGRRPRS